MNWDLLNKTAIIVTIIGGLAIPSIIIWYWNNIKDLFYRYFFKKKYISKRLSGRYSFDYSNNDGKFQIGKDNQFFELKFTKAGDTSIHIYKDPPSIEGVAIANGIYEIGNIKNASIFDMSSKTRNPKEGEIVVLKNIYGNYCAVKILDIKDNSRNDKVDEITLEYLINGDGYTDFRK